MVKEFKVQNQVNNIERYKKKQQAKSHPTNKLIRLLKKVYERTFKKFMFVQKYIISLVNRSLIKICAV